MCKIFIISLLSLFINSFATAQSVVPSVIMGRDTIPHVLLHEVDVVARLKNPRKYARQQQRNLRMIHNVKKVFPYAKIAAANGLRGKTKANYQARVQGTHAHLQATVDEINRHTGKDSRSPNLPGDEQHVVQSHQRIQGNGKCLFLAITGSVVRE